MNAKSGFSLQVALIRQIQADNGHVSCYATPAVVGCAKKQTECSWRHDCFHEAEELDGGWSDGGTDKSWIDGASYRCGSELS